MASSVQHWPGGIPHTIKPHPETDLSLDQLKEKVKGWLLFVQESWVPRAHANVADDNEEYELHQRRNLVEQWASATQEFRDSFHTRAPIGLPGTEGLRSRSEPVEGLRYPAEALERLYKTSQPCNINCLISLAPVDETHPVNRAWWVKFAILLYRYDPEAGHCLLDSYMPSEAVLNPATHNTHSMEDFLIWSDLEVASFGQIYLTRTGTVIYLGHSGPYMLVDEDGLKTGRLTLVNYKINGAIEDSMLIRPFNMRWAHINISVHGKGLEDIRHCQGGYRHQNQPIDMDLPILDILCHAQAANQLPDGVDLCDRQQWEEDVELYAPGYLALEAAGRGGEYDLNRLAVPNRIEGTKKGVWQRLRSDPRMTFPF